MKFFVILAVALGLTSSAFAAGNELLLRDNLKRAQQGDFLVSTQNKNYTVLLIRGKDGEQLYIEEITLPSSRLPKSPFSWRKWVEGGAPGHTCWLMYTVHLPTGIMQQTYSYTRNEWVTIPQSQNFFSTLLNLKLNKIDDSERKKVGPPPAADSRDRRRTWQPDLVVDGSVIKGVTFDAWRTRWPNDGTDLSGKVIEVYVPQDSDKYPAYFPYWLQISGIVGNAKVRIVDSGSGLVSPKAK